jgi:hypothetical protein
MDPDEKTVTADEEPVITDEEPQRTDYPTVLKKGIFCLSKPYKYGDGPEQTTLNFPLSELTGQHIRTAQSNYSVLEDDTPTGVVEFNKNYQAYVAAALMKVPPDFVFGLPAKDFTALTLMVGRFLLG